MLTLERQQWIPKPVEEIWEFFADPKNLNEMTPDFLHFEILTQDLKPMHAGQIIEYRIEVLPKYKRKWVTEITECVNQDYFIDEQRSGPYRFWHHRHQFEARDGGVWMSDRIHFQMRQRLFGNLIYKLFVRKRLKDIFEYRAAYLQKRFGASPALKTGSL